MAHDAIRKHYEPDELKITGNTKTIALCLIFFQCAGQFSSSESLAIHSFETDRPFRDLYEVVSMSIMGNSFSFVLDISRSNDQIIVTRPLRLRSRDLVDLAVPITKKVRGKFLDAYVTLEVRFQSSQNLRDHRRVSINSIYQVYVSRLGDKRQWIQWRSNGTLEKTILENMITRLEGG